MEQSKVLHMAHNQEFQKNNFQEKYFQKHSGHITRLTKLMTLTILMIIITLMTLTSSGRLFAKSNTQDASRLSTTSLSTIKKSLFSQCHSVLVPQGATQHPELTRLNKATPSLVWHKKTTLPFSELIVSWNASRPKKGHFMFYINIKHKAWSGWKKIAEWGSGGQKTFCNTRAKLVHVKHVRAEMQQKSVGQEYKIKVESFGGANLRRIKALFANVANWQNFKQQSPPKKLRSTLITNMTKQSQWWLDHKRKEDLCSAASLGMVAQYFANQKKFSLKKQNIKKETVVIANNAYDSSLDIFGNWLFNVAQVFNTTHGKILYRVERLNNFEGLHAYLEKKIPVAVSIRGNPRGCAWPYKDGHFVVVIGWDKENRRVICLDPAFDQQKKIIRHYRIDDFVLAWGKSRNLSYIPIPSKKLLTEKT